MTTYNPTQTGFNTGNSELLNPEIFPNPSSDFVAIQLNNLSSENIVISLFDINGKKIDETQIYPGSTIAYFDTRKLYAGDYFITLNSGSSTITKKIVLVK